MFNSDVFDFSPATPERLLDIAFDVLSDALVHKFEPETFFDANGYAVLRAVRWMAIGFAVVCLGALALGVAVGGLVLAAWRWGQPALEAHCIAVEASDIDVKSLLAEKLEALKAFVLALYGDLAERVGGWLVKELA